MPLLIHPTHRKYIALLKERTKCGDPIVLINQDKEDFLELTKRTKQRLKRHQGIYRITLRAMSRPKSKINDNDVYVVLNDDVISIIAKTLARLERKQLGTTLLSAFVIPRLRVIIRWLNRHEQSHSLIL